MPASPTHQVAETPGFTRQRRNLGVTSSEYETLLDRYATKPNYGDLIVGTGGLRKGRVEKDGTGKSGGYRVFSAYLGPRTPVYLLWIIDKTDAATISAEQKAAFKAAIASIRKELAT